VGGTTGSRLQLAGVLSAGSLASGSVAPGEIITLIGSGIGPAAAAQPASSARSLSLGGTSVLLDGKPAPLLSAAPNQINALLPYGVSGQDVTQMLVMSVGQVIAGFPLSVAPSVRAIFTVDASGVGPGAILTRDSTINSPSNPAKRGRWWCSSTTGTGQSDSPALPGTLALSRRQSGKSDCRRLADRERLLHRRMSR
jgi:uncharacterized protein (TIGR03437 family)